MASATNSSHGAPLQTQVPDDCLIWSWLFENKRPAASEVPDRDPSGFQDASTQSFLSLNTVRRDAIFASCSLSAGYGLRPGQNVAVVAKNSIWYPVAMFAAIRLGVTVSALPPSSSGKDLSYFFKAAGTRLVFVDPSSYSAVVEACRMHGIPSGAIISLEGGLQNCLSLQDLIAQARDRYASARVDAYKLPKGESNRSTCAFLSFSSGTTGLPKAVMISHSNVIWQLVQVRELGAVTPLKALLAVLPFYHITGLIQLLHLPVVLKQEVIVMSEFSMASMLQTITRFRCEELWLVPPLLIRLVNDAEVAGYDLSCVKQFNTGAAPLATEIVAKLEERYPSVAIRQVWGMTESCGCLTVSPIDEMNYSRAHCVGKAVPGTTLRVIDPETGRNLETGGVGELLVRGPQVTMGYLNNPEATHATYDSEGFLHTGDLGSVDGDGFVTIHDRLKELIKVKGNGVAPAEIEDFLLGHPVVKDVAVVGMHDRYSGEVPLAFVVLQGDAQPNAQTAAMLQQYVKDNKARYKWLTGGVQFIGEIPKSAAGKILRRLLRERAKSNAGKAVPRL